MPAQSLENSARGHVPHDDRAVLAAQGQQPLVGAGREPADRSQARGYRRAVEASGQTDHVDLITDGHRQHASSRPEGQRERRHS